MSEIVDQFLRQIKERCEKKSIDMARLELSVWDEKHERELIEFFGYTKKSVKARKIELTNKTKNQV